MTPPTPAPEGCALYYPFHLCHERTLSRLLGAYTSVHFRDYMALQLTPMSGTTAYNDRMGQSHPDLVKAGRIVQGYPVSGPLDADMTAAVNRNLADPVWRAGFHHGLRSDRRFQRGLFDLSHSMRISGATVPGPAALLRLLEKARATQLCSVERARALSCRQTTPEEGYEYEYALAMVNTSAALAYTIRLCRQHELGAVTDSPVHFNLLAYLCARDNITFDNRLFVRDGY
jgi:hypothetical protein